MKNSNLSKKNDAKKIDQSTEYLKKDDDSMASNKIDKCQNRDAKEASASAEVQNKTPKPEIIPLKEMEATALINLREAHKAIVLLASRRLESKLSNTRVVGVARELNELIKVMAVYETV